MSYLLLVILVLSSATASYAQQNVRIDGGHKITPLADITVTGSATLIHAADSSRIALNCTNSDSSVNVRWGNASVTATTGQRIAAGSAIEIKNIGAVYMISEGANVTVSCTKETH